MGMVSFGCALTVGVDRVVAGADFADAFVGTPEAGLEVIVVPLDAPEDVKRFDAPAFFNFHIAGAYDEADTVVVDYIHYPDASLLGALGSGESLAFDDRSQHVSGTLYRARLNLATGSFEQTPMWDGGCEFPRLSAGVEGGRHEHVWVQSEQWQEGVLRFGIARINGQGEVTEHRLPVGQHASEPVMIRAPGGGEEDGVVTVFVYDTMRDHSHVLVLDARHLEPLATIDCGQAIPLRFHGCWVPARS